MYGIAHGFDVSWFALAYFVAGLAVLIISIVIFLWRYGTLKMDFNLNFWKTSLVIGLPFYRFNFLHNICRDGYHVFTVA